jgi:hydrophobic/amphiphilic exporter-1 (mainly G- bacteria), HAE1 family
MTTLLMLAVFVLGVSAFFKMPVSNLPDVNYPVITVTVPFPGTNPEIMANTVATPLEKQFMTIPGIKTVTSSNTLGSSTIVLQFNIEVNIDLAAVDVESAIVAARPQLPPNLPQEPTYKKINPSATPIIYIVVTSLTMTQGELYDYANTVIGQRLNIIDGVSQIQVIGSPFAVRAQLDPGMIARMGITQQDIATVLANQNQYNPLGQFDGTYSASTIYDNGGLFKAAEYDSLIVAFRGQAPVYLRDVGKVLDSLQNDRSVRRYIDKNIDQVSVTLAVLRQPNANAVTVAKNIHQKLEDLKPLLPASLDTIVVFDRSESILASIKDVELTLVVAFILVVLVIFVYLGKIWDTIIPSVVMPMAIIATFAVMYPLSYTIDTLSLLALALAIGFIVDDAVVVLENIVRRVEQGETPLQASLNGSKQISFTIVSMTISLVAVFIPIIFMAGIIGKLFSEFAITLSIVTIASGVISLTLTPMLCSRFIPPENKKEKSRLVILSHRFNDWMLGYYKRGLVWVLHHRIIMLLIGLTSIILSLILFRILPTDFIPDDDIGFIIAYTEAEQGTSSEQMARYHKQITDLLKKEKAIKALVSLTDQPQYRQGLVLLALTPADQRKPISELIPIYNQKLSTIPGVNVYLKSIPLIDLNIGAQVRGAYQYLMQSLDSNQLFQSADALFNKLRDDPMFQSLSTNLEVKTPQINLDIQRELASTLGIDTLSFEQSLLLGYSGNRISRIQTPIDQYDLIVELDRDLQRNPNSFNDIYLRSSVSQQMVPFTAVANWTEGVGPASINHFAQFPAVTINFNLAQGVALSEGIDHLRELANKTLNPNVLGDVQGTAQEFETSINSAAILLIVTIFTIYIVLGMLYESFIHPLTILSTLPPAIVGGLLILFFTGRPLSLYAFLGIILLIGIVKKNGILIVDFALDNIRHKGESAEKSIFDACVVRFRPIMMTTAAAIMGAVPIALGVGPGAESRRPLGYVIIAGMCVSQLVTLFLTPVIYLYLEQFSEWAGLQKVPGENEQKPEGKG